MKKMLWMNWWLSALLAVASSSARTAADDSGIFKFTQNTYNVTLPENARGQLFAKPVLELGAKMGVFIPRLRSVAAELNADSKAVVRFKIVDGDPNNYFAASTKQIGNFAFMQIQIRPSSDATLNRELKDVYELYVKAKLHRKGSRTMETMASVSVHISDENDLVPLFLPSNYETVISDDLPPFSSVIQVYASDADVGQNGQVYYSLAERSINFTVHPVTGVISTLRPITLSESDTDKQQNSTVVVLTVQAQDRTSLLAPGVVDNGLSSPPSTAQVKITITRSNHFAPTVTAAVTAIDVRSKRRQTAAIIRVSDADIGSAGQISDMVLVEDDASSAQVVSSWFSVALGSSSDVYLLTTLPGFAFPSTLPNAVNLTVVATDSGEPSRSSSLTIRVPLAATSNHSSALSILGSDPIVFSVNETVPVSTPIGYLELDGGNPTGRQVAWAIKSDRAVPFQINSETGVIRVSRALDFESESSYELVVLVTDVTHDVEKRVLVKILDENDNDPVFIEQSRNLRLTLAIDLEAESVIGSVNATDADSGENGRISYRLLPALLAAVEPPPFLIDPWTGEIKLMRPFSALSGFTSTSSNLSWELVIRASDMGRPLRRESETAVLVTVTGSKEVKKTTRKALNNRHAPHFADSNYQFFMEESSQIGTVLGKVVATDSDLSYNGFVQYVLNEPGNANEDFFKVDTYTGDLLYFRPFHGQRLAHKSFDLRVTAFDSGRPRQSSRTNIRVVVKDSNNNRPQFDRPIYRVSISEDAEPNTDIVKVTATDLDDGDFGIVNYHFDVDSVDFAIDPRTGVITLKQKLDRERIDTYRLKVLAADGGQPSLTGVTSVIVTVVDVNNHSPKCVARQLKVQIAEDWPDGALVTCLDGYDRDAGNNSAITFALDIFGATQPMPFTIDPDNGCVFVALKQQSNTLFLDFETRPLYNLSVEVTDRGQPQFSSTCILLVELIDVNENRSPPLFDDFALEASVYENEPSGTEVIKVTARDPDDPLSREPIYSVYSDSAVGLFTIDSDGFVRTSAVLDREQQAFYWLTITAEDHASVPLLSSVHVFVQVLDRNDNRPTTTKPIYFANIEENSPAGTVVTKVEAHDADENTGPLHYRIVRGNPQSFFAINPSTGLLTTHQRRLLDREALVEHELEISIEDTGSPKLKSSVLVVIHISDQNDNAPTFQEKIYNFNVPYRPLLKDPKLPLCRIFASDPDEGANGSITYKLTEQPGDHFSVDENTGEIFARYPLLEADSYALTIEATDGGSPPLSGKTRVMLAALGTRNDTTAGRNRAPRLTVVNETIHIADTEPVGQAVGLVTASDADEDTIWFQLQNRKEVPYFSLRSDTGEIQIAKSLRGVSQTTFALRYMVTDGVSFAEGTVIVVVTKGLIERPHFDSSMFTVSIGEDTPVGSVLRRMNVSLPSSIPGDTPILYGLRSVETLSSEDKFEVDANSGDVILIEPLDRERQRRHLLTIVARHKQMESMVHLQILVTDENDHAPTFAQSVYEAKVAETSLNGAAALRVIAIDLDVGQNGMLTYHIISGNELGQWKIDSNSGAISVGDGGLNVDYPESVLVVRATDGGSPPKTDTCTVRILVVMAEDSPPRFYRSVYVVTVPENLPVGSVLTAVFADSATGGVRYAIASDDGDSAKARVHPNSGFVYLEQPLNFEAKRSYNITVRATTTTGRVGKTTVNIRVEDSNDHAPIFEKQLYEGFLVENSPAGQIIMSADGQPLVVSARDHDQGSNAIVSYRLVKSWASQFFSVEHNTGAIRTTTQLDYEQRSEYRIQVSALDAGNPPHVSLVSATVVVTIRDTNDEPPTLKCPESKVILTLPTVQGVFITQCKASDPDTIGKLRYSLSDKYMRRLFGVDAISGRIQVVANNSSSFVVGEYRVKVDVSDGVRSASAFVTVEVQDLTADSGSSPFRFRQSSYSVSIVENSTRPDERHTVVMLETTGTALGEHVTYRLLNECPWFRLNSVSGELITTGVPLDREQQSDIKLVVRARDQRSPPRFAQVIVRVSVLDVNDCAPQFVGLPYRAVIPLDAPIGANVTRVSAVDRDEGSNGQVVYSISKNAQRNGDELFAIDDDSGWITLAKIFPAGLTGATHHITVVALDRGKRMLSSETVVTIAVVNKAVPVFEKAIYSVKLSEDVSIGTQFLTLSAISKVGGTIGYAIVDGDPDNQFLLEYLSDLNSQTIGSLSVQRRLDRETTAVYNLTVRAVDVGREQIHADAFVRIELLDVNDSPPRFADPSYTFEMTESAPVGTTVATLNATDADTGPAATIRYSLQGADSTSFEIDRTSGAVTLTKALDFEKKRKLTFTAVATDDGQSPLSTSVSISIDVLDVNDNAPQFDKRQYSASIPSDVDESHFVTMLLATDADGSAELRYKIVNDGESEATRMFAIDEKNGVVTTTRKLEQGETVDFVFNLTASVTDGVFTAYSELRVTVVASSQLNAQKPLRFSRSVFEAAVKENWPPASIVTTVSADGGKPPLRFSFGGETTVGEPRRPVRIDAVSGRVSTRLVLNYEQRNTYTVPLAVRDAVGRRAFATLLINVIDQNDNAPKFVANKYSAAVPVNTSQGKVVMRFLAVDPDAGDDVEYSMFKDDSSQNLFQYFKLHRKRGQLSVRRDLRKFEGETLHFFVRATDRGNPPKQTEVPVEVYIAAADETVPRFKRNQYEFSIKENAAINSEVGRIRLDSSEYLVGDIKIVAGDDDAQSSLPFSFDDKGRLVTAESLDREATALYRFHVQYTTSDRRLTSYALVTVHVTDVNDNAPVFLADYRRLSISEDAPVGTSVTVVSVADADEGVNAQVELELQGDDVQDGVFKIDRNNGWLLVQGLLDREKKDSYRFTVVARDRGAPTRLRTSTDVVITVTDSNDNAPQFDKDAYRFEITESARNGAVLGRIIVTDPDLDPNNRTELFLLQGGKRLFGMRDSGELYLKGDLDFETDRTHQLTIVASDGKFTSKADVSILVRDENDNPPVCTEPRVEISVSEDIAVGSKIFQLVVEDPDLLSSKSSKFTYSLRGSSLAGFRITRSGAVVIARSLDRETMDRYSFFAVASDPKQLSCRTEMVIVVTDVNDSPPVFSNSTYRVSIKENLGDGAQFLLRLLATDPDLGSGGKVQYALEDSLNGLFKMDELTGVLTVTKSLDRETTAEYRLTAIATDQGLDKQLSTNATIIVSVADVNDNAPAFTRSIYELTVEETAAIGEPLMRVEALNADTAESIRYYLVNGPPDLFAVDEVTGVLSLSSELDYEKGPSYALEIEAIDNGEPPLSASTTVQVTVTDVNDNPPAFSSPVYDVTVLENATVGTVLIQVTALDPDSGSYGAINYSLAATSVQNQDLFSVNEKGEIVLLMELDRENRENYKLLVEARDGGDPSLSDTTAVKITVIDVNDNPPVFQLCNLTAVIQEGLKPDRVLLTVEVTDADDDGNGAPFTFGILGEGADKFYIGHDGALTTTQSLRHRDAQLYLLTVIATDSGNPPLRSECPLSVRVLEESKHAPEIEDATTEINVYLGEFPGGPVAKARASDRDPRDVLVYSLIPPKDTRLEGVFSIDPIDGVITASAALPVGEHKLNVTVKDGRFTSYADFDVLVHSISEDILNYALSMRFGAVTEEQFVAEHRRRTCRTIGKLMGVSSNNVRILSIQRVNAAAVGTDARRRRLFYQKRRRKFRHRQRRRQKRERASNTDVEMLFTVAKNNGDAYFKPNRVRRRLDKNLDQLTEGVGLEVIGLVTEVCRRDLCAKGECKDRLTFDDTNIVSVVTKTGEAFVAPKHKWSYECVCRDGYSGTKCEVPHNSCHREPCPDWKLCIPVESTLGFKCACPAGKTGAMCSQPDCPKGDCATGAAVSFNGKSYLKYALSSSMALRLQLQIQLRTVAANGVLAYAKGNADYHILEIVGGYAQYRFDCGGGNDEAVARIDEVAVADGKWHNLSVVRRGSHARLSLDNTFTADTVAPGDHSVLNLNNNDIYFGATVAPHPTLYGHELITNGFIGCLNRITVDSYELPKKKQPGLSLYNVDFQCTDPFIAGICSSAPCQHSGTCVAKSPDTYRCFCLRRFSGRNCEIDVNPCASNPCQAGARCINSTTASDFFCVCPPGRTGRTCSEVGDFNPCLSSPCASTGTCLRRSDGYLCRCPDGYTGSDCKGREGGSDEPNLEEDLWPGIPLTVQEIVLIICVLLVLIVLTVLIICCCCRRRVNGSNYRYYKAPTHQNNHDIMLDENQPHINPLVCRGDFNKAPPPLPPRGSRGFHPNRNNKLSNLESAQMTGLPTVAVRPMSYLQDQPEDVSGGTSQQLSINNGWRDNVCRGQPRNLVSNLEHARNYGSAADELEQLGRQELMHLKNNNNRADARRPVPPQHRQPTNVASVDDDDWKNKIHMLSDDSIDRIKAASKAAEHAAMMDRRGAADGAAGDPMVQSTASIQCLPEDDPTQDSRWDYSDYNSVTGRMAASEATTDDEESGLPMGVSALEETDSEFVGDEDDLPSSVRIPDFPPTPDFKQQLLKLQRLTERANNDLSPSTAPDKQLPPSPLASPTTAIVTPLSGNKSPEDVYVTMKPLSAYQRHIDRYLYGKKNRSPPDSSRSQRKPLLASGVHPISDDDVVPTAQRAELYSDEDSDGAGSNDAVVQYGFPSSARDRQQRRRRRCDADGSDIGEQGTGAPTSACGDDDSNISLLDGEKQRRLHGYDLPLPPLPTQNDDYDPPPAPVGFSSFMKETKRVAPMSAASDKAISVDGQSVSNLSAAICDIDDIDYDGSDNEAMADKDSQQLPTSDRLSVVNKQTVV